MDSHSKYSESEATVAMDAFFALAPPTQAWEYARLRLGQVQRVMQHVLGEGTQMFWIGMRRLGACVHHRVMVRATVPRSLSKDDLPDMLELCFAHVHARLSTLFQVLLVQLDFALAHMVLEFQGYLAGMDIDFDDLSARELVLAVAGILTAKSVGGGGGGGGGGEGGGASSSLTLAEEEWLEFCYEQLGTSDGDAGQASDRKPSTNIQSLATFAAQREKANTQASTEAASRTTAASTQESDQSSSAKVCVLGTKLNFNTIGKNVYPLNVREC